MPGSAGRRNAGDPAEGAQPAAAKKVPAEPRESRNRVRVRSIEIAGNGVERFAGEGHSELEHGAGPLGLRGGVTLGVGALVSD